MLITLTEVPVRLISAARDRDLVLLVVASRSSRASGAVTALFNASTDG